MESTILPAAHFFAYVAIVESNPSELDMEF